MTVQVGLKWMGVMTLAVTVLLAFVHFPMWGSMFFPANPDISEEDYYIQEWTAEEVAKVSRSREEDACLTSSHLPVALSTLHKRSRLYVPTHMLHRASTLAP